MTKSIRMLYEDDAVIVVDKPAGILTIPAPGKEKHTLIDLVNAQFGGAGYKLHLCHRLDRDTSGAIMFAKGKANQQQMMELFHRHEVKKKYLAFVRGTPHPDRGEIKVPIKDFSQKKFKRNAPGRPAVTRYRVVKSGQEFSVVEAEPVTGRTNQIRIHFAKIGHPLLGERVYAFRKDFTVKFRRTALHSQELFWRYPGTNKPVHIICEMPQDMTEFLHKNFK
jgi:23S rRNA pseudouridine1911/1915/1917 synthase